MQRCPITSLGITQSQPALMEQQVRTPLHVHMSMAEPRTCCSAGLTVEGSSWQEDAGYVPLAAGLPLAMGSPVREQGEIGHSSEECLRSKHAELLGFAIRCTLSADTNALQCV
jgi:hypothetical protein